MKKLYLLLLFSNFIFSNNIKINDSVKAKNITVFNSNYKDFIIVKNKIYAVTNGDSLISLDLKRKNASFLFGNIKSIIKTSKNEIIGINTKGKIFKLQNKKINIIDSVKGKFQKIYLDKNDNYLIISTKGIYYLNEYHIPKIDLNFFISKSKNLPIRFPDYAYTDKKNRFWISYDRGEWGEDTIIFNLLTKEFQSCDYLYLKNSFELRKNIKTLNKTMLDSFPTKLKIINDSIIYKFPNNLPIYNPIKGISENKKGEIFISQSLMHVGFSGGLYLVFEEEPYFGFYDLDSVLEKRVIKTKEHYFSNLDEYIGTCTFNKFNNNFYYYTDKGFFKLIKKNKVFSKEFIFKPWVTWNAGLPMALGYQMNVNKFEFISEKGIIFLTANDGIGYFNGKEVIYFK